MSAKEVIRTAIKAAGPDDIPTEAIKVNANTSVELLYNLFCRIWETGELPVDWREGYPVKLLKKANLDECENYGLIMGLSLPGIILSRVIIRRLKDVINMQLRDEQARFR